MRRTALLRNRTGPVLCVVVHLGVPSVAGADATASGRASVAAARRPRYPRRSISEMKAGRGSPLNIAIYPEEGASARPRWYGPYGPSSAVYQPSLALIVPHDRIALQPLQVGTPRTSTKSLREDDRVAGTSTCNRGEASLAQTRLSVLSRQAASGTGRCGVVAAIGRRSMGSPRAYVRWVGQLASSKLASGSYCHRPSRPACPCGGRPHLQSASSPYASTPPPHISSASEPPSACMLR